MTIDWFTFAAQIINFLILIWLLNRFLYGPIVQAMKVREETIAARFAEAADAQSQADHKEQQYDARLSELAQTKELMIAKAGEDVDAWRHEHLRRAKADVEDDRRKWHEELTREKHALLRELQLDVTQHAVELGQHVLQELADQRLQTRLIERFLSRLRDTDLSAMKVTGSGSHTTNLPLKVQSSHELTEQDRTRIEAALQELNPEIEFQIDPQLICGIEILAPGCRFTWNLRESLAEVELDLIESIEETLPGIARGHTDTDAALHQESVVS